MWRMLEKRPLTRLGMLAKAKTHEDILRLVDAYSLRDNEFYFDRDPKAGFHQGHDECDRLHGDRTLLPHALPRSSPSDDEGGAVAWDDQ